MSALEGFFILPCLLAEGGPEEGEKGRSGSQGAPKWKEGPVSLPAPAAGGSESRLLRSLRPSVRKARWVPGCYPEGLRVRRARGPTSPRPGPWARHAPLPAQPPRPRRGAAPLAGSPPQSPPPASRSDWFWGLTTSTSTEYFQTALAGCTRGCSLPSEQGCPRQHSSPHAPLCFLMVGQPTPRPHWPSPEGEDSEQHLLPHREGESFPAFPGRISPHFSLGRARSHDHHQSRARGSRRGTTAQPIIRRCGRGQGHGA